MRKTAALPQVVYGVWCLATALHAQVSVKGDPGGVTLLFCITCGSLHGAEQGFTA